ncbi:thioredoxin reductase (NADPH) [Microbacteriaceae bacterium MWH-Ta3]|nr:thioredoxin reductase (NADPH) [Microbacteriaceae bacterium MWH-Ta3]
MRDLIIIGSGPAGYTAAIYAARADLKPVVITSSVEMGGDLMKTTEVDNFPGFPEGVMGPELMMNMQAQAERFGAELIFDDAVSVELEGPVKKVTLGNGDVLEARAVILSTGSEYRRLGLDDEARLSGFGVSWCATCDGAFFRKRTVAVVGGGDSAMEEATFLTRFADKVYLLHRSDNFRASPAMLSRAKADAKIEFVTGVTVTGIQGTDAVSGITLTETDGSTRELAIDGLFVAIGADPRTALFADTVTLTEAGTVAVDGRSSRTNLAGVFAAGDVIDPTYRQAITAAGSGAVAALDAQHYLESAH